MLGLEEDFCACDWGPMFWSASSRIHSTIDGHAGAADHIKLDRPTIDVDGYRRKEHCRLLVDLGGGWGGRGTEAMGGPEGWSTGWMGLDGRSDGPGSRVNVSRVEDQGSRSRRGGSGIQGCLRIASKPSADWRALWRAVVAGWWLVVGGSAQAGALAMGLFSGGSEPLLLDVGPHADSTPDS